MAQVICYYLTQFHEVPENNEWWGEGFTEWTNVKKATPIFEGHYQPHIPRDGYYDLMNPQTFRHQIDLAKQYGIGGFCFYYYWFNGRKLLDKPLEMFLRDSSLDMPFCLMWANETWSRRWDGSENEILVQQRHNAEDDIAFIASLKPYLLDPRYIRIEGKPLISVYRLDLFQDIAATVMRWREWCRENGIGELYVVNTLTRGSQDHTSFDCALEFPPHGVQSNDLFVDPAPTPVQNFSGKIYNYKGLVCGDKPFKVFKCVCPSWDNTPRRGKAAHIFYGSTPEMYRERLLASFKKSHHNTVFINAWNEWGEGAHLEPDIKFGDAYLRATKEALTEANQTGSSKTEVSYETTKLAVVIHAYYPDILREILAEVLKCYSSKEIDLFITTTKDKHYDVAAVVGEFSTTATIDSYDNRGKDILPFITTVKTRILGKYSHFLKLHTKLNKQWRTDLLTTLLNPSIVTKLKEDFTIGLVGPKGHLLPLHYTLPQTKPRVTEFANRIGSNGTDVFIAGSMFYGRVDILHILLDVISNYNFEDEGGQRCGTLAHVIERSFVMAAHKCKTKLIDTDGTVITRIDDGTPSCVQGQPPIVLGEKAWLEFWGLKA